MKGLSASSSKTASHSAASSARPTFSNALDLALLLPGNNLVTGERHEVGATNFVHWFPWTNTRAQGRLVWRNGRGTTASSAGTHFLAGGIRPDHQNQESARMRPFEILFRNGTIRAYDPIGPELVDGTLRCRCTTARYGSTGTYPRFTLVLQIRGSPEHNSVRINGTLTLSYTPGQDAITGEIEGDMEPPLLPGAHPHVTAEFRSAIPFRIGEVVPQAVNFDVNDLVLRGNWDY